MIITGGQDIVTLPQASREIVSGVLDGQLLEIEGAGHMGFMERHELYNTAIHAFAHQVFDRLEPDLEFTATPQRAAI